jgi:hypothetical protein
MQSIIVYRNPLEAAFWESNALVPIMAGVLVFFVLFLSLMKLLDFGCRNYRISRFNPTYKRLTNAALAVATIAGLGTMFWMVS